MKTLGSLIIVLLLTCINVNHAFAWPDFVEAWVEENYMIDPVCAAKNRWKTAAKMIQMKMYTCDSVRLALNERTRDEKGEPINIYVVGCNKGKYNYNLVVYDDQQFIVMPNEELNKKFLAGNYPVK